MDKHATQLITQEFEPAKHIGIKRSPLKEDNYQSSALVFRDRQAGVTEVYDPFRNSYTYNAYCLETKLLKELFSCEYDYLEEALEVVNSEFGTWELKSLSGKSECGSCVAK